MHLLAVQGPEKRRSYYVRLQENAVYSTIAGPVRAERIAEAGYGGYIKLPAGVVYVLKPTLSELMEHFYVRETQVIYPKDSGLIALLAGLKPGMRVVEAGVGSGFLTTVIASHVCPTGLVLGFEVRRRNLEAARRNLELAGLDGCVELVHGDVRRASLEPASLDAGFLDMPDPWEALDTLWPALKPGAPLVVFLPTFNQVEKLAARVDGERWVVQAALETMMRYLEPVPGAVRPSTRTIGFTGFIVVLRRVGAGGSG
ncbi:MAG: tRNA (adenine-N1)-methyltransferase [Desulfurococcales archaeon]|nr:tRNA (adenine-N1)-methyltransferase [Desulfurococcales archaeon]